MTDKQVVNIKINFDYDDDQDIHEQIQEAIRGNVSEFREYFSRLISADGDSRTTLDIKSTEIEDFGFNQNSLTGHVCFIFYTDFYAGCKDMNSYDDHSSPIRHFSVNLSEGKIEFDEFELPPVWQPDIAMEDY